MLICPSANRHFVFKLFSCVSESPIIVSLYRNTMKALKAFLAKHRCADGKTQTHGSTPPHPAGGSHAVPPALEGELLRLLKAAPPLFLTLYETPLPSGMPLIVDLDIAVPLAERPLDGGRLFNIDHIRSFCLNLRQFYASELELGDANVTFYISQRPEGYESGGKWKDGVHIQSPDLWQPASTHRIVRDKVLKRLENEGFTLSQVLMLPASVNAPSEDIWDSRLTTGTQPWYFTGCGKVDAQPYYPSHKVVVGPWLEGEDESTYPLEQLDGTEDLLYELSLRRTGMRMFPCLLPQDELAELFGTMSIGAAGGGFNAEDYDPSQRPKVESLLALLSDERAGRMGLNADRTQPQGCGEVIQAIYHILGPAGQDLALAFAQRSDRHWTGQAAVKAKSWFRSVFHDSSERNMMGALCRWAAEDSPDGYKAWQADQPPSAFGSVEATGGKLSPERSAALLKEITAITLAGVEIVPDKDGQPFNSRFIFGTGAKAATAGLNDLAAFHEPGSSIVIRSHLGTGKTTLFRQLAADPKLKVLYISARRTFTRSMLSEFNSDGLGFRSYFGCDVSCGGDSCDRPEHVPQSFSSSDPRCGRFFCQVESLHKFQGDCAYDLLVLDESESILASLQPGPTQVFLHANVAVFEQIVRAAGVVVAGDAFVTDRTMRALKALRPSSLKLLNNAFNPYSDRICERIKFMKEEKGVVKECLAASKNLFHKRITDELDAGKRIVIVCASSTEALSLVEGVFKPRQLTKPGFSYMFYYAQTENRDKRNIELADVNASWAAVDVLIYTPTITVGINYDNAKRPFDLMFLYGCRMGPTPRDMFQASLRCRSLKENKVVFFLSHFGPAAHPVGAAAIVRNFAAIADGSPMLKAAAIAEAAHQATLKLKKGGPAGGALSAARGRLAGGALPPWYFDVLVANTNEAAVSQTLPEVVYAHFLAECGYACAADCDEAHEHKNILYPQLQGEGLIVEKFDDLLPYSELADLEHGSDDFKRIELLLKSDVGVLPRADRQAMNKWKFKKRCGLLDADFACGPLEHAARVRLFGHNGDLRMTEAEAEQRRNELQAIHTAEQKALREWATPEALECLWGTDSSSGFARGDKGRFWRVAIEKMPLADGLRFAHRKDAMDVITITSDQILAKLTLIKKTLNVLGMEHSCEERVWSAAEWERLLPMFQAPQVWPDLPASSSLKSSPLMERLGVTFGLRNRRKATAPTAAAQPEFSIAQPEFSIVDEHLAQEGGIGCEMVMGERAVAAVAALGDVPAVPAGEGYSPSVHLQLDLNTVFSSWSGTALKASKDTLRSAEGFSKADYDAFYAEMKKELTADASFSPTKLKLGVKPKSRHAAADWEPGFSKQDRADAIAEGIKLLWDDKKAKAGGGEGFRTVPAFGGLLWAAVVPLELGDEAEGLRIE